MQHDHNQSPFSGEKPAVFLDRDGTLIEDVGYLKSIEKIDLFPDTLEALKSLQKHYLLFILTNQSGVAKGLLTMDEVSQVNTHLNDMLQQEGIMIQKWYVCPHSREDGCSCIKPKPGFVISAQREFSLDLRRSFVIGDHPHDALTANEQGVTGLYVLTGHGKKHLPELPAGNLVFSGISEATDWIMENNAS